MSTRYAIIALFVAAGLHYSTEAQTATALTDIELNNIVGGAENVDVNAPSLPQQTGQTPQQPALSNQNQAYPNNLSQTDLQNHIGLDLYPQVVAVLQSELKLDIQRNLILYDTTQQNTHALNVENVAASDAITTNNILVTNKLSPNGTFDQNNQVTQLNQQQGALDSSTSGYRYETTIHTNQVSENHSYINSLYTEQRNFSEARHHEEIQWDIGVDKVPHSSLLVFADKIFNALGGDLDFENINTGFAFAGQGNVSMKKEASLKVDGQVTIEVNIPLTDIELFTIKLPFKVVDITIAPFEFSDMDGVIKAVLFDGGVQNNGMFSNDEMSYMSSDYLFLDNSFINRSFAEDLSGSSYTESVEHDVFIGGQVNDARADIIGMSSSKLTVDSNSDVTIDDRSQQNLRAVNAVNSTTSISANSFNMSTMQNQTLRVNPTSGFSLNQNNRFIQRL